MDFEIFCGHVVPDSTRKIVALLSLGLAFLPNVAAAHGVSSGDAPFVAGNQGAAVPEFLYLGAKHMVTGYDHLLFLVGVIFFLYRMTAVVYYVSLFTIGHSITLLAGVLGGVHANPYLIDAIIGLSVVYKALDNMGGFKRLFGFQPDTKAAVLLVLSSWRRHPSFLKHAFVTNTGLMTGGFLLMGYQIAGHFVSTA